MTCDCLAGLGWRACVNKTLSYRRDASFLFPFLLYTFRTINQSISNSPLAIGHICVPDQTFLVNAASLKLLRDASFSEALRNGGPRTSSILLSLSNVHDGCNSYRKRGNV